MADFFHRQLFPKNFFNLICCFHTLDHVINPNQFIEDVYQVLKPQGYVLFIVHNVESLAAKLLGGRCPIFDIEHIFLFNKKTLAEIFAKNKFKVVKVFAIKNQYPLRYWLKMSPLPNGLKRNFIALLKKICLAEASLTLVAGNIGIIAQKVLTP